MAQTKGGSLTPDDEAFLAEAFLDVVLVAVVLDLSADREVLRI